MLRREEIQASNGWLVATGRRPTASARLICFSPAGTGAASYRGWAELAPPWLEVCAVQLPGRETRLREAPVADLDELVPALGRAVAPALDRPFAFYGHSLGSIVAFETARWLRRNGAALPAALCVGASRPPQSPWPDPPVRDLPDLALLEEVNRRYESVPDVVMAEPELRQLLTPALRADMALIETYRYRAEMPFDFPIHAFGGAADRKVTRNDLSQWQEQTLGAFDLRLFPDGHLFLLARKQELMLAIATLLGRGTLAESERSGRP